MAGKRKLEIITGSFVSLATTLVSATIIAGMISGGILEETYMGYLTVFILLVSTWLGTKAAIMQNPENRIANCVITGAIYFTALVLINALFFERQYQNVPVTAITVSSGCVLSIITGVKKRKNGKRRRSKI